MMEEKGSFSMTAPALRQKGSIIVYILIAIFLTGLLVSLLTQGPKKSATSGQINEVMMYLQADIQTIQSNITECAVSYQDNNFCPPNATNTAVSCVRHFTSQDSGNPNPPFPVYTTSPSTGGTAGAALASILCPRAPAGQQAVFPDKVLENLKLLQDTANYTTTYFTENNINVGSSGVEGIYLRIERTVSDPVWTEAIVRMNNKYSACTVAYVAPGGTDPAGYTCTNGCLYYWILRLPTSSTSWKAGCP